MDPGRVSMIQELLGKGDYKIHFSQPTAQSSKLKLIPSLFELATNASQACRNFDHKVCRHVITGKTLSPQGWHYGVHCPRSILSDVLNTVLIIATKSKYVES